jgi:hypothetical protein
VVFEIFKQIPRTPSLPSSSSSTLCSSASSATGAVHLPRPPLCCCCRSTSCSGGLHASLFPYPGPIPLLCCPLPRAPRPPELAAGRHACCRRCQLLLARAAPLPILKHAQQLLCDLLYSLTRFSSTAFPFPERSSSSDLRRSHCSPSTATVAASQSRSNTPAALRQPTSAPQPIQFRSPAPKHHFPHHRRPPPAAAPTLTVEHPSPTFLNSN